MRTNYEPMHFWDHADALDAACTYVHMWGRP